MSVWSSLLVIADSSFTLIMLSNPLTYVGPTRLFLFLFFLAFTLVLKILVPGYLVPICFLFLWILTSSILFLFQERIIIIISIDQILPQQLFWFNIRLTESITHFCLYFLFIFFFRALKFYRRKFWKHSLYLWLDNKST